MGVNDSDGEAIGVEDAAQLKHWVYVALERAWYQHHPETSLSLLLHFLPLSLSLSLTEFACSLKFTKKIKDMPCLCNDEGLELE